MSGVSVIITNRAELLLRQSFYTAHAALLEILVRMIVCIYDKVETADASRRIHILRLGRECSSQACGIKNAGVVFGCFEQAWTGT